MIMIMNAFIRNSEELSRNFCFLTSIGRFTAKVLKWRQNSSLSFSVKFFNSFTLKVVCDCAADFTDLIFLHLIPRRSLTCNSLFLFNRRLTAIIGLQRIVENSYVVELIFVNSERLKEDRKNLPQVSRSTRN